METVAAGPEAPDPGKVPSLEGIIARTKAAIKGAEGEMAGSRAGTETGIEGKVQAKSP